MDQRLVKSILFDPILWQNFYTFRLVAAGKEEGKAPLLLPQRSDLLIAYRSDDSLHKCC